MLRMFDVPAPPLAPSSYVFDNFRLGVARRLLYHGDQVVRLPERVFQILRMLVEANGEIVDRETIASRVWPDSAVSDGNIAQHVYILRRILGEHARDRRLIMAVNRRGYRLTVPVVAESGTVHVPEAAPAHAHEDRAARRTARALRRALELFEASLQHRPDEFPTLAGLARAQAFLTQLARTETIGNSPDT
jgi:DNA-binding winged helix-turn-helix (wHTH) protein